MSWPAMTATFICELQVRTPGPSSLKEAYFIKIGPWSSHPYQRWGWFYDAGAVPWPLPNRYHRGCNKCSRMKSVFSQRPFGTLPKGQLWPISGLPALQSVTFLCRSAHDIMLPYKSRYTSKLWSLNIQLLGVIRL